MFQLNRVRLALEPCSMHEFDGGVQNDARALVPMYSWPIGTDPTIRDVYEFFFEGWTDIPNNDKELISGQQICDGLFYGVDLGRFCREYVEYLKEVRTNGGTLQGAIPPNRPAPGAQRDQHNRDHFGRFHRTMFDGTPGAQRYPTVAIVAQRIATVPLNVCSNERFFSLMDWSENSRTHRLGAVNFISRSLQVYNGPCRAIWRRLWGV